jgi:DNA-binding NarL/FixJ family response regulator
MIVKSRNTTPVIESFNLSERETEILKCLTEGMSYKMVADDAPLV